MSFLVSIKVSGFYYYDVFTDIYFMQILFKNCHNQYGYTSLVIMITSYVTTVLYLIFRENQKPLIALCFPVYYIAKSNNITILNGYKSSEELTARKFFTYQVMFLETLSKSVLQLCLSCLFIRKYGLSVDLTERFIQVTGLVSSLMCICISFSQVG